MKVIGEYIISVTTAAIVCGCICSLSDKKGTFTSVIKFLCGIFLSLIVFQGIITINIPEIGSIILPVVSDGQKISQDASELSSDKQRQYISDRCETYISQKAESMGCVLDVTVSTSDKSPYLPCGVEISGHISPYSKNQLSRWIDENFSIPAEDQQWTG